MRQEGSGHWKKRLRQWKTCDRQPHQIGSGPKVPLSSWCHLLIARGSRAISGIDIDAACAKLLEGRAVIGGFDPETALSISPFPYTTNSATWSQTSAICLAHLTYLSRFQFFGVKFGSGLYLCWPDLQQGNRHRVHASCGHQPYAMICRFPAYGQRRPQELEDMKTKRRIFALALVALVALSWLWAVESQTANVDLTLNLIGDTVIG